MRFWHAFLAMGIAVALTVILVAVAEAGTFRTPSGVTCATVRYWYQQLGGEAGVRAYGRANNITLTASQYRQARACLRMRG